VKKAYEGGVSHFGADRQEPREVLHHRPMVRSARNPVYKTDNCRERDRGNGLKSDLVFDIFACGA